MLHFSVFLFLSSLILAKEVVLTKYGEADSVSGGESADYDPKRDVYYVSDTIRGKIVSYDPEWNLINDDFIILSGSPLASAIVGDYLYVVETGLVTGVGKYNLDSRSEVAFYNIDPSYLPNGLCYDYDNDRLYVTDTGYTQTGSISGKQTVWVFDSDLSLIKNLFGSESDYRPNGCFVDQKRKRVLFVQANIENKPENTKLLVYDIRNDKLFVDERSDLECHGDGIIIDNCGNIWVSCIFGGFSPETLVFGSGNFQVKLRNKRKFEFVMTNSDSITDIGYDSKRNRLIFPSPVTFALQSWDIDIKGQRCYDKTSKSMTDKSD